MENSSGFQTFKNAFYLWFEICMWLAIPSVQKHCGPLVERKSCPEILGFVALCLPEKLGAALDLLSVCLACIMWLTPPGNLAARDRNNRFPSLVYQQGLVSVSCTAAEGRNPLVLLSTKITNILKVPCFGRICY